MKPSRCRWCPPVGWDAGRALGGWYQGTPPRLKPPASGPNVWNVDQRGQQDGIHPTQEPTELFSRLIRWHTVPGDIWLEPFSGSGTQIIAAEQLGRRCFAMEQAPAYCDVAVSR